jgi:hypothetical protein
MIGDCKQRYDRDNGNGRLKNPTAARHKHWLNRRTSSGEVQVISPDFATQKLHTTSTGRGKRTSLPRRESRFAVHHFFRTILPIV